MLAKLHAKELPRLVKLWADQKYHNHALYEWLAAEGWYELEIVSRPQGVPGFTLLPYRWVVERTFAWLNRCRIHSKEYERLPACTEAQVQISMIHLMLRRLTGVQAEPPFHYQRAASTKAA